MNSVLPTYDEIGSGYNLRRAADDRILAQLDTLLAIRAKSKVLDVGAGTGNYTLALAERGYQMWALEPSPVMINSASDTQRIQWCRGVAEEMPFDSDYFDAAYCTLSLHHFRDQTQGLAEICRVLRPGGRFVAFTSDPRRAPDDFWMRAYFGELFHQAKTIFPPIDDMKEMLSTLGYEAVIAEPYLIPSNNTDGFFCSSWRRPHDFLDERYRNGISAFRLMHPERLAAAIGALKADLESGEWERQYGAVRDNDEYDGGYTFIAANKSLSRTPLRRQ